MIYFISDLHLGHENCIQLCNRPFENIGQMNERLIENWNKKVKGCDTVYIVGDLVWQTADPEIYLSQLKGNKILITGNHDKKWLERYPDSKRYFEEITNYLETKVNNLTVTFCHYPMIEWAASRKVGSKKLGYHIHGHIHNGWHEYYRDLFMWPHALNAGADINGFEPVTMDELIKNNERHKLSFLSNAEKEQFLADKRRYFRVYEAMTGVPDHEMKLQPGPYELIKSGQKTVEVRLFDDKRKKVKAGDVIKFTSMDGGGEILAEVFATHKFDGFSQLFASDLREKCGFESLSAEECTAQMRRYYSEEQEKSLGVIAIEIRLL